MPFASAIGFLPSVRVSLLPLSIFSLALDLLWPLGKSTFYAAMAMDQPHLIPCWQLDLQGRSQDVAIADPWQASISISASLKHREAKSLHQMPEVVGEHESAGLSIFSGGAFSKAE